MYLSALKYTVKMLCVAELTMKFQIIRCELRFRVHSSNSCIVLKLKI